MINQNTGSLPSRPRRYTLSRLLELAPRAEEDNFDLSKFTYDAARAGVVPPLGACVMPIRRVVSDQPRNWSQESSESQEEFVVYAGNRTMQPTRQPTVPPSESRVQQDKGFARFLEKHSSPTHQRVTAGGRIVPMEQRPRPPVFSLPPSLSGEPDLRKDSPKEHYSPHIPAPIQKESGNRVNPEADMKATKAVPHHVSVQSEAADNCGLGAGLDTSFMFPAAPFVTNPGSAQSATFPVMQPSPLFPGIPFDAYGIPSPQIFPITAIPLSQSTGVYNGPLGVQYHPPLYQYGEVYGVPGPIPMADGEAIQMYCQHMILSLKSTFEELDKQLKSIDRHRAMINHDTNIATQRMAIVQQRAEVKNEITYWEDKLAFALNNQPPTPYQAIQHGTRLNVQAESYVPLNSAPATATFPLSAATMIESKADSLDANTIVYPTTSRAPRRAIPIVAPPKPSPPGRRTILGALDKGLSSPSSDVGVDEWGVRIGRPPPHIERQQSEMLAAIIRAGSESPDEPIGSVIAPTPQTSSKSSSFNHQIVAAIPDTISEGDLENAEWLEPNPGDAPATVEAYYELQLDAMRLPQGLVSKVRLPDGTITEVPGRGLQRPPSFNMDDFERRYWTSKPTLTKEMATQFVDVRRCSDRKPLGQLCFGLNGLSMESETSVGQTENTIGTRSSQSSHSSRHHQQRSFEQKGREFTVCRDFGHGGHKPADIPSTTSNAELLSMKQPLTSGSNIWAQGDDNVDWPSQHQTTKDWESVQDGHLNKGYSSVSVQNVHAMGHLPHMLDGTIDGQKSSAKSLLSAAGKVRSPTLIHRPSPTGGAWFGPHSRQVQGHASEGDGSFQSGTYKVQGM